MKLSDLLAQYVEGDKGETIFYMAISDLVAGMEDQLSPDGVLSTLNRMANFGDDRSRALLAALASEAVIDKALEALMPKYAKFFGGDRSTALSMKIKMLEALAVVPSHLTEAADIVRGVRNSFAHKLTVEKLGDLDEKVKGKMKAYYSRRKISPSDKRDDLPHVFDQIAWVATAGLSAYLPLVRDLNDTIRHADFEGKLRARATKRQSNQIKLIMQHVQRPPPQDDPENTTLF